jgi:hypothetical protein
MIEPDLKEELDLINSRLERINNSLSPTRWRMLVQGLWRAVGYIIGLVLAVALLGWMLNIVGVVPALQDVSNSLNIILQDIRGR